MEAIRIFIKRTQRDAPPILVNMEIGHLCDQHER